MAMMTEEAAVVQIGEVAGAVWKILAAQGPMSLTKLVKDAEAPRDMVMQAIGWLAREDKLTFEEGRTRKVGLK